MAQKSPTSLNTPRNLALAKGTVPAGFADPIMDPSMQPLQVKDVEVGTGNTPPPVQPSPFGSVKGA